MKLSIALIAVGCVILFCSGALSLLGVGGGTSRSETIPVSVRDNPSSYRPAYAGYSGYRAPVTTSSGGYSSGK